MAAWRHDFELASGEARRRITGRDLRQLIGQSHSIYALCHEHDPALSSEILERILSTEALPLIQPLPSETETAFALARGLHRRSVGDAYEVAFGHSDDEAAAALAEMPEVAALIKSYWFAADYAVLTFCAWLDRRPHIFADVDPANADGSNVVVFEGRWPRHQPMHPDAPRAA